MNFPVVNKKLDAVERNENNDCDTMNYLKQTESSKIAYNELILKLQKVFEKNKIEVDFEEQRLRAEIDKNANQSSTHEEAAKNPKTIWSNINAVYDVVLNYVRELSNVSYRKLNSADYKDLLKRKIAYTI